MSGSRMVLYFFGIVLVVVALAVLFFATGLNRWIPVSLLGAGILLIIGLAVMGFANDAPSDHRTVHHDDTHGHDDVTVIKR